MLTVNAYKLSGCRYLYTCCFVVTQYGLNPFRPRGDAYAGGCGRDSQCVCTIRRPTRAPPCSKLSTSSSFFVVFSYSLSVRCQPVVISVGAVHWRKIAPSIYPPTTYGVIWGRGKTAPRYCQTNTGQGPWIWGLMEEPEPGETLTIVEHKHPLPSPYPSQTHTLCSVHILVCSGSL